MEGEKGLMGNEGINSQEQEGGVRKGSMADGNVEVGQEGVSGGNEGAGRGLLLVGG